MHLPLTFIRILFLALCTLLSTIFATASAAGELILARLFVGALCGIVFGFLVISLDRVFKRLNLRTFNIAAIGLFFGYLMGEAVILAFQAVLDAGDVRLTAQTLTMIRSGIFLIACYMGMVMTAQASEELYASIPFIKFKPGGQKKKDLVVDVSALSDSRLFELASTGLLDQQLVIPRFLIKEIYEQMESGDEAVRTKARRAIDNLKKLEGIASLEMRYHEHTFPETKEIPAKLMRLARLLDANILTVDVSRSHQHAVEGVRVINLNALSQALKPLAQTGEMLNIKIQRYGKEPRQGVGYLDDGTMVVVNGGAEYIGETIRSQVLSVKHTASGRMIFCNALESSEDSQPGNSPLTAECESSASNYFAL